MLIGIISDTHDHIPHAKKAVDIFKQEKTELVLHAGDYCSPFMIPLFKGLPLKGIFGNNDGDRYLLISKFREIGAEIAGDFLELQAGGLSIAVYHGTYSGITDALQESGRYDVVVSGHTHQKAERKTGSTLAVNPGTAHGFDGEAGIALLDTQKMEIEFISLN